MTVPSLSATLLYHLGQRDIQWLLKNNDHLERYPFTPREMAAICQHLQRIPWEWQSINNSLEIDKTLGLKELNQEHSPALTFPLLEKLLRQLRADYPGLNLLRIIFINTNRQDASCEYASKEPYLFHTIIKTQLPALLAAIGFPGEVPVQEVIITDPLIDSDRAFQFWDRWFYSEWPRHDTDAASLIFINHGPGIPSLGRALTSLAGVYHPERVVVFDQVEHQGPRFCRMPLYEQAFKDRHGMLSHLKNLDLQAAWSICRQSSFYKDYEPLKLLLAAAAEALAGDPDRTKAFIENLSELPDFKQERWSGVLASMQPGARETLVNRSVTRLLNAIRRQDFLSAGLFFVVTVECASRLVMQYAWPGCLTAEDQIDPGRIPSNCHGIFARSRPRSSDGTYTPNFLIYERAMGIQKKSRTSRTVKSHADSLSTILNNANFKDLRQDRNKFAHAGQAFRHRILAGAIFPTLSENAAAQRFTPPFHTPNDSTIQELLDIETGLTGKEFIDWTIPMAREGENLIISRPVTAIA